MVESPSLYYGLIYLSAGVGAAVRLVEIYHLRNILKYRGYCILAVTIVVVVGVVAHYISSGNSSTSSTTANISDINSGLK